MVLVTEKASLNKLQTNKQTGTLHPEIMVSIGRNASFITIVITVYKKCCSVWQ
jgi:hypothetical protein